ncbi:MAG: hypothetical protein ACR2NA_00585 [Solirubrobacterales bacterium]
MRRVNTTLTWVLVAFASVLVGFGIPLFWFVVGSYVQGSVGQATLAGLGTVLLGIMASYIALGVVFQRAIGRAGAAQEKRQEAWNRGLRDSPRPNARVAHPLEAVLIGAASMTALAFVIFVLTGGSPGVPPGLR